MLEFLSKFEFLNKIFRRGETRQTAKERLRLVLVHDRASVSPQIMESLKEDLIGLISRYLEIDVSSIEIGLEKKDGSIALAANIPIMGVKRKKTKTASADAALHAGALAESTQAVIDAKEPAKSTVPAEMASKSNGAVPALSSANPRSQRKKRAVSRTKRKTKTKRLSGK